jgi:putative membrane protein
MRRTTLRNRLNQRLLHQIGFIARVETGFFRRHPRLIGAAVLVAMIPSIYLLIYLSSIWDPVAQAGALPVGIVNLDSGYTYRDQSFNIGKDVTTKLNEKSQFGYRNIDRVEDARQQVRQGKLAFTLLIPPDFSANAIPGLSAGGGQLTVYTSAGNNYESAVLARQFAKALGEEVNDTLNAQRWALVLRASAGSQQSVDRLRDGVGQLRQGAKDLVRGVDEAANAGNSVKQGSQRLREGVQKLTDGTQQLGAGVKAIESGLPPADDVRQMRVAADALAAGHLELDKGMKELRAGSQRLLHGVEGYKAEANGSVFVPARVSETLDQLSTGIMQLDSGLGQAQQGQQQLSQGDTQLSAAVRPLVFGVRDLRANLRTMISKLPEDQQLEQLRSGSTELSQGTVKLSDGLQKLREGSQYLAAGTELLLTELPARVQTLEGSAEGLAHSVSPVLEIDAEVPNHGSGFAPNIISLSLWLGAGIAVFLIRVRTLPHMARGFSPLGQFVGKAMVPMVISVMQALLVMVTLLWVLGVTVRDPVAFALMLLSSTLAFLFIVFALARAFGDAGKAMAMILLALQLSASGGVLPVELSGTLYAKISPWLPITWVVKGMKAAMFDAYEGNWQTPFLLTTLVAFVAAVIACWVGRWQYASLRAMRPALDL